MEFSSVDFGLFVCLNKLAYVFISDTYNMNTNVLLTSVADDLCLCHMTVTEVKCLLFTVFLLREVEMLVVTEAVVQQTSKNYAI